jgi:hypothetical protein
VLVGDGSGAFEAKVDFATGSGPRSVAAGDLNGDGLLDLATSNAMNDVADPGLGDPNPGPGTISVLQNSTGLAPPAIAVTPDVDLFDGQTVSVDGSGFSADVTSVHMVQCAGASSCTSPVTVGVAGGSFTAGFTVVRFVGPTDCAASFGSCIVAAANLDGGSGGFTEIAVAPIGFVAVATAPGAPTIGTAVGGDAQATVSWTAPASDGGSPVTGYVVTPYVGYSPQPSQTFISTATTQVVTGLTNFTQYRFRVQAINGVGTGGFSKVTNPIYPAPDGMTVPGAPTIGSATAGDAQATVSWTAPASDGGSPITGYVVTAYIGYGPQSVTTFVSTATTQVVTGLTNGSTYRFRVRAINAVGTSGYSTVTNPVTPTA